MILEPQDYVKVGVQPRERAVVIAEEREYEIQRIRDLLDGKPKSYGFIVQRLALDSRMTRHELHDLVKELDAEWHPEKFKDEDFEFVGKGR